MKKPKPGNTPRPSTQTGPRGRWVGIVAVAKGRYQIHLLETVGETVVKREVLVAGRKDVVNGREVRGETLAPALAALNVAVARHLREASDLWMESNS